MILPLTFLSRLSSPQSCSFFVYIGALMVCYMGTSPPAVPSTPQALPHPHPGSEVPSLLVSTTMCYACWVVFWSIPLVTIACALGLSPVPTSHLSAGCGGFYGLGLSQGQSQVCSRCHQGLADFWFQILTTQQISLIFGPWDLVEVSLKAVGPSSVKWDNAVVNAIKINQDAACDTSIEQYSLSHPGLDRQGS